MSFHVLPLPPSEYALYIQLTELAFRPGINSVIRPSGLTPSALQHVVSTITRFTTILRPGRAHLFKVVDSSLPSNDELEGIVGVAQWQIFPKERSEGEMEEEKKQADEDADKYGMSEGLDEEAMDDFSAARSFMKKKHMGGKPCILLAMLATRPSHNRRGLGSLAMKWGCDKADELGLPIYLEASPKGVGLYKKCGFEVVDELPWDARKYGYHDSLTHLCMIREPRGKTTDIEDV